MPQSTTEELGGASLSGISFARRLLAGALFTALLFNSQLTAQIPDRSRQFVDEIDVEIVNLDIYVLDRKGRPVTGLELEDFHVTEDSRAVEITHFLAVEGQAAGAAAARDGSPMEPLQLVIYLDDLLTSPNNRNRVIADIDRFLDGEFPAETTFMLVTNDEYLDVIVPHTPRADSVRSGLRLLEGNPKGIEITVDRSRASSSIQSIFEVCQASSDRAAGSTRGAAGGACDPCADVWEEMVSSARQYAITAETRVTKATDQLARFIAALGGLPGRKALVYVSGGLEQNPGWDMFLTLEDYCPDREREINTFHFEYDETTRLNRLAAHANANRVTFYPLDAGGVRESKGTRVDQALIANLRGSLFILSQETGGESIFNANRPLDDLRNLTTDLTNYYSIAYRPIDRVEAPNHLVDVDLVGSAAKGRTLRYRRTIRAKTSEERLAEQLMATLMLGAEQNPLGIEVAFEEQQKVSRGLVQVPVRIDLTSAPLLRLQGENGVEGRLRFFMTARDERNRGTTLREQTVELKADDLGAPGEARPLSYVVKIDLEPGSYQIAIGVRDEMGKSVSLLRRPLEVAEDPASASSGPGARN